MRRTLAAVEQLRRLGRDPLLLALIVAIFACLAVFVLFPLVRVLMVSLQDEAGQWSLEQYRLIVERRLYWNALVNSVAVATVTGIVSVALGYLLAFVIARTDVPFKR